MEIKPVYGFKYYVEAEDPDILILIETKVSITSVRRGSRRRQVNDEPIDPALSSRFPYRYWTISEKKTYCILSHYVISASHRECSTGRNCHSIETQPLTVDKTLPGHPDSSSVKCRNVALEFENYYVIGTHVVNAGQGLKVCSSRKDTTPLRVMTSYYRP